MKVCSKARDWREEDTEQRQSGSLAVTREGLRWQEKQEEEQEKEEQEKGGGSWDISYQQLVHLAVDRKNINIQMVTV